MLYAFELGESGENIRSAEDYSGCGITKGKSFNTMNDVDIRIVVAIICLVAMSAYFSATETAFSALNRIKLKSLAEAGNKKAAKAMKLADNYDNILSTILIGNNIVNIVASSIATVMFTTLLGPALGVPVSTAVLTVVILIFGEISPKSIAKDVPEKFAMWSAPMLNFFCIILKPLNLIFSLWKVLLTKIFKVTDDRGVTEEEILTMVSEAENDGEIDQQEGEMIRNIMDFDDLTVEDILKPRVDVVFIHEEDDNEEIASMFEESGYSRVPIYGEDLDDIVGVLNQKDFFMHMIRKGKPLEEVMTQPMFVAPSMKIGKLLTILKEKKCHLAIVVDEYGGVEGIVTLEDIIEELVGEIWDEHDEIVEEIVQVSETEYTVKGNASVTKLFELLGFDEELDVVSVSGWISQELGKIPEQGDQLIYRNVQVDVIHAEERRVSDAKITVLPKEDDEE